MKAYNEGEKIELIVEDLEFHAETAELRAAASMVLKFPDESKKQPDLLYFSGIFVSTGSNLNGAHFLGSELVFSRDTIVNKAMDVEHEEDKIVGHIYAYAFTDKNGKSLDDKELASKEVASLDSQEMHVLIAGIVYKNRFPNFAREVAEKKWCLSMECYYQDFDVKIGDMLFTRPEATMLGLACNDERTVGQMAKVVKDGREIAKGKIARVLRGICFSGCGFVKNPANPPSVVIEVANNKLVERVVTTVLPMPKQPEVSDTAGDPSVLTLIYQEKVPHTEASNNVTSVNIDTPEKCVENNTQNAGGVDNARDGLLDDSVGICVNYRRRKLNKSNEVVAENWCTAFEQSCTSFSRDTTDPECLIHVNVKEMAKERVEQLLGGKAKRDRLIKLLDDLNTALQCVEKIR